MSVWIELDFHAGTVEGAFPLDKGGLITALETLAAELRGRENRLSYMTYDEGTVTAG